MSESVRERYGRWRLEDLLLQHPGLRIVPTHGDDLLLAGIIRFCLQGPSHEPIEDSYVIELRIAADFPETLPTAREKGGRIASFFHKLEDNSLCVGAPTELRHRLTLSPTLLTFVDQFVVTYLFSHSYFEKHGTMPFDELEHGSEGIGQHLAEMFHAPASPEPPQFLLLASMKKRSANKRICPCGSGRRLGRCHNRRVNQLRDRLGRGWFRTEYARVQEHLESLTSHPNGTDQDRRGELLRRQQQQPKRPR